MAATNDHRHHIVMLPFMAQGHLIPFLALAKQLHRRFAFKITIATTPLNVRYLETAIAKNSSPPNPHLHLSQLPFDSSDHNLPPNTENTENLPFNKVVCLFQAASSLKAPFETLVRSISAADGTPPLCIISDVFMGWAKEVAESCGTVNIGFTTGGAYGTAAYVSIWRHLPHHTTDEKDEFRVPGFPESCKFHLTHMHRFLREADGTDSWSRFFQHQLDNSLNSFGWLCNTAEEIEPLGLEVLKNYTNLPIWCIGPVLPPKMVLNNQEDSSSREIGKHTGREPGVSPEKCLQWLDSHPERSVLYVSFGSQNTISQTQTMALAMGLEDSKKPFIWVVRPPFGFNIRGEFKPEWLPDGFEERTAKSNQGLVVKGWAPQLEILCHKSTGGFLSHCGWNSVMESLSQGVPMIGWPLAAEQGYNAKMLVEEAGVCVEMTRGVQSQLSREEVREVIERVMGGGEKAKEMRRKAAEIGRLIRGALTEEIGRTGSALKAMDDFVAALIANKQGVVA